MLSLSMILLFDFRNLAVCHFIFSFYYIWK